ncbi:hypothetical protein [uncultured Megasphaera sp.]|uniref:hypothetical protein n=1 Tax=uncultured Megasphaera sp. TaxID=165188 RepID=UPI002623B8D3|nr:hypothetical protein [uncultured Megasphaera sp.]
MTIWILISDVCYTGVTILGAYKDKASCQEAFEKKLKDMWHKGTMTDSKGRTRSACLTAMDYRDEIDLVYLWAKEQPLQ